jgi:hypothetical protein
VITRYLFLAALFVNGAGSSILAVGYPYGLLSQQATMSHYYATVGVIFVSMSSGALLWGRRIDLASSIWKSRVTILAMELFFSVALLGLLLAPVRLSSLTLLLLVALLEFLFVYEIPWSRVAWNELNQWSEQRGGKRMDAALAIVVTTSLISAVGPGVGALLGMQHGLEMLVAFKVFSLVPYLVICAALYRKRISRARTEDISRCGAHGLRTMFRQPDYLGLALIVAATLLANAFLMVALPVEVTHSMLAIDPLWIALFYLLSAIIPLACIWLLDWAGLGKVLLLRPLGNFFLLMVFGCLFFYLPSFFAKCVLYLLYNIGLIQFNVFLTSIIYRKDHESRQGRLFSLVQVATNFSFPLAAMTVALAPGGWQGKLPLVSFAFLSLLAASACFIFRVDKFVAATQS